MTKYDRQPPDPSAPASAKRASRIASRGALKRLTILFVLIAIALTYAYFSMIKMPGETYAGPLPQLTEKQRIMSERFCEDVAALSGPIVNGAPVPGHRSIFYPKRLAAAASWIHDQLTAAGFTTITEIPVERGSPTPNFEVIVPGKVLPQEIIVIGAHYDAFQGTPGADDNATGVAAVLHLAREFRSKPQARTLRFVLFVNEEPPAFQTNNMGSWVYAKRCRAANDNIVAMLALECLGYYNDQPGSQQYPRPLNWLYPDTGNFIAFISNYSSRDLNKRAIASFRSHAQLPSQGGSPPGALPGVGWSDHWAFWQEGYPGLIVSTTAIYRNPNYHQATDTEDTLDFDRMARVVDGLEHVITDLATP